ncbi:MAG: GTP-binding protein [Lachnospiraceae bacterium]|nr:GTP-binding protein [Lachnospiraceae bacterium]
MTKVDIISGFLGAGKTTLIKKLIEEVFKGQKIVLIENEFGEIGIDGGFLKDAGINITEMNSGCICCSLVGDFGEALNEVIETYHPDRIIIEPSGVGKLSDVITAVLNIKDKDQITISSLVAVCDATKSKMYMKNFGEFYNNQIESAKTIILSRTQKMTDDKLAKSMELIREHNKDAAVITTPWDEITGAQILEAMERNNHLEEEIMHEHHHEHDHEHDHDHDHEHDGECSCGHHHDHDHDHEHDHEHHDHEHDHEHHHDHDGECSCGHDHDHDHDHEHHHHHDHDGECSCGHHHDHDADEVFVNWGVETIRKFSKAELEGILAKLAVEEDNPYGIILRAKGIVQSDGEGWLHFDLTPGEYEVRNGSADYTGRICVIGSELKEDVLKDLFQI